MIKLNEKLEMFFQCLADPNAPTTTTQSPPSGNGSTIFHGYADNCA